MGLWELVKPRRGILALGFLLMLLNRVSGLVLPASTKFFIDDVVGKRRLELLVPLLAAVVGATFLQGVTSFTLTQVLSKATQRLIAELRARVQAHVGRLPVSYFDHNKSGALVSRIMSDVEGVRNLLGTGMLDFVGGLLTAVIALVIMLRISWPMTLVAALLLGGFGLVLRRAFRTIRPIYRARSKINAEVAGRLTESLGGVRVVKGYHAEAREEEVFRRGVGRLLDNVLRSLTASSAMGLAATTVVGISGALVMYLGAREIAAGHMTLGSFVTFSAFLAYLVAPMSQVVGIGTQLTEAFAGLERTRELLAERREDLDPERSLPAGPVRGTVEFEDVWFGYDPETPVLRGVSFRAEPGTVTALVGPSGAGKSTIIGLIAAFYRPTTGQVRVDGVDLGRVRLDSYRTQLGVVLQDTFLFDGTVRENVLFSRPGAGEDEFQAACRTAHVEEFALRLENGYETVIGERGVKLSGGQKQRVSIARALVADPRILILDEATSSLDTESEALIQEGLAELMRGRTTFVIAHRLSTIRQADQILVIEDGRIVERGTHETLLARHGRYFEMYTRQHGLITNLFLAPGEDNQEEEEPEAPVENNGREDNGWMMTS